MGTFDQRWYSIEGTQTVCLIKGAFVHCVVLRLPSWFTKMVLCCRQVVVGTRVRRASVSTVCGQDFEGRCPVSVQTDTGVKESGFGGGVNGDSSRSINSKKNVPAASEPIK